MPKRKVKFIKEIFKIGDIVTWTSQAGGYYRTKTGKVVQKLYKNSIDPPWLIAREKYSEHKVMFDGNSIPGNYDIGFFVEVKDDPKTKLKLYFPNPSLLRKVK